MNLGEFQTKAHHRRASGTWGLLVQHEKIALSRCHVELVMSLLFPSQCLILEALACKEEGNPACSRSPVDPVQSSWKPFKGVLKLDSLAAHFLAFHCPSNWDVCGCESGSARLGVLGFGVRCLVSIKGNGCDGCICHCSGTLPKS